MPNKLLENNKRSSNVPCNTSHFGEIKNMSYLFLPRVHDDLSWVASPGWEVTSCLRSGGSLLRGPGLGRSVAGGLGDHFLEVRDSGDQLSLVGAGCLEDPVLEVRDSGDQLSEPDVWRIPSWRSGTRAKFLFFLFRRFSAGKKSVFRFIVFFSTQQTM